MWNDEQRRFMNWMMSSFFIGEERVTTELLPFAIAAPTDDQRIFLASQIADEARHCVFFDRFYREVMNSGTTTIAENLAAERPKMHNEYIELFDGILHDAAETLRKDPSDMDALVRGVTVYMIVIEGTLALTGARFILRYLKEADRLPGFRDGFTHVNRDESRHVGFGVKFLCDAIKEDEHYRKLIQECLSETLPTAVLAFSPDWVENRYDFDTPFGYHSSEMFEYAMRSLSKKLAAMGMSAEAIAAPA
jgi:ribonucleoside-diphosphate reductase beta chain